MSPQPSTDIRKSLRNFRQDYPNPDRVGLIIVRFITKLEPVVDSIRRTLRRHRLKGLLATDRMYHDNLLANLKTYMAGCGFGIAVLDAYAGAEFNANVAFEIGYMMAQHKPVLILKDKRIPHLYSDLQGRLYKSIDLPDSRGHIPKKVTALLRGSKLIPVRMLPAATVRRNRVRKL
jgi:hypothetical protein